MIVKGIKKFAKKYIFNDISKNLILNIYYKLDGIFFNNLKLHWNIAVKKVSFE